MKLTINKLAKASTHIVLNKAKTLPHGEFEAILSTDDLDRHGEHVSIKGMAVPKDQVVKMYYNHETTGTSLPIGLWSKVWKSTDGKLMGRGQIDLEDDFAVKVYKKVLGGFIDSISIGFMPQEFDGDSSTWTKSTLVEASVVAEPANVNARITSKQLGFTEEEFKESLKVKLADVNDVFVGEEGTPPEEVVKDPATYDLKTPEQSEPAIDENSPEANPEQPTDETSKDGASDELNAALEELKSRVGAVEDAMKAATENPATKSLIKVRLAGKQVDKAAETVNRLVRIKLQETN